jgi:hypothetical protein
MVDARDIAAVAAAALTGEGHEGKRYVVTGPEALTFADAAQHLSTVIGRPIRYVDLAPGEARQAMVEMGLAEWYVSDLLALYEFYSTGAGAVVSDTVPTVAGSRRGCSSNSPATTGRSSPPPHTNRPSRSPAAALAVRRGLTVGPAPSTRRARPSAIRGPA